jgi:chorismate synthase
LTAAARPTENRESLDDVRTAGALGGASGDEPGGTDVFTTLGVHTAGESHGPGLVGILEGLPAGLAVDEETLNRDLWRRQQGYGRGKRMQIEHDRMEVLAGVRFGRTLGSPVAVLIRNRDFEAWHERMAVFGPGAAKPVTRPRPGHADLAGGMKYGEYADLRNILERASARETAARVALGAFARALLAALGVEVVGQVAALGGIAARVADPFAPGVRERLERSPVRVADADAEAAMVAAIDAAKARGDTLGGVVEVRARGVVPGIGSHVTMDRRLDARLAAAVLSVQAIKGVEVGDALRVAAGPGSVAHDEIVRDATGVHRGTNRAGGTEGGITNGEEVVVRAAMKPLSTLIRPLRSIDLATGEAIKAAVERSDVTAVPAAAVVVEAMVCLVLADAYLEKFGGDSMPEVLRNLHGYRASLYR